jgi:predicted RND superfamily exporter protein
MKRLNRNMHGDDPSTYMLPDSRELAAQYLLLYEMSLPFGQDLNNQINVDKSSTRLTVTLKDTSTREMRALAAAGEDWLQAHGLPAETSQASGPSLMFAHISGRNIKGMLTGTAVALLLVSLTLVLAFRSFGYGLLSLVPNIAPAVLAFGIWGLLVGQVNLGLSAVAAMTIGIVVDDTIHFLAKYLRARREHEKSPEDAVRFAFHTVAPAMLFTSIVLAAGFLVLTLSSFGLNSSMGKLTAITIGFALATDFLMLPPILVAVGRLADKRKTATAMNLALENE